LKYFNHLAKEEDMKKTTLEKTRDFFNDMVGMDKPFRSRLKLADFLGMKEASLRTKFFNFLKGDNCPSYATVTEWLEKFGGQVLLPEDPATLASYRFIPKVAAVAGAGATLETSDEVLGYYAFRSDFLGREHISECQSVMMQVRGDSMEPLMEDGDTLLVDQSDTQVMDGKIYVVTLGDELRVKRVQKGMRGYILRSENPRYADIVIDGADLAAFRVHGRVRWVGKLI
jgi:SOS-response transcriptional repressor LexA